MNRLFYHPSNEPIQTTTSTTIFANERRSKYLVYEDEIIPQVTNYVIKPQCIHRSNLTIIVTSAPDYFDRRTVVRRTYSDSRLKSTYNYQVYFAIGYPTDETVQRDIATENERYGDIIQWNFEDSYAKLTRKTIAILHWSLNYCSKSAYVMKIDDDSYVNVFNLFSNEFFSQQNAPNSAIYGKVQASIAIRRQESKLYVPKDVFEPPYYPKFALGAGYILSQGAIGKLFNCSIRSLPLLLLEDVAVTGIAASKCPGLEHQKNSKYFTRCSYKHSRFHLNRKMYDKDDFNNLKRCILFSNHLAAETLLSIHQGLLKVYNLSTNSNE